MSDEEPQFGYVTPRRFRRVGNEPGATLGLGRAFSVAAFCETRSEFWAQWQKENPGQPLPDEALRDLEREKLFKPRTAAR